MCGRDISKAVDDRNEEEEGQGDEEEDDRRDHHSVLPCACAGWKMKGVSGIKEWNE
jgi:hypothetical protein